MDGFVTIRFFSVLRERTGRGSMQLPIPTSCTTDDVERMVIAAYPSVEPYASTWRVALNQTYVAGARPVSPGDELAFITPVSGG